MKIELVLGCLILAAFVTAIMIPMIKLAFSPTARRRVRHNALGDGTHAHLSLRADAPIGTKNYLVKRGSDANHAAVVAAASDEPLGVCPDEADAAEDPIDVILLGVAKRTVLMVAQGTIAADVDVYSYGDGTVTTTPAATGTYWKVGKSRTASTAGLEIEVEPCQPRLTKVVANAATLATTQAAMVNGAVVIVLGA
ncbi:hypothetical protein [Prosthecobacter vanneervenii]|uniref:Uncharacterized protein n=1 Tax=Prosthecobacter vanneervenii TaxID=48466 RepID=A0A7W7YC69_9BACT|nr:hypothetical protein [Prosthecobacter vanneervenii]MBB5033165.1 hypothetical protein [Prosthecobacter vanneervenii]